MLKENNNTSFLGVAYFHNALMKTKDHNLHVIMNLSIILHGDKYDDAEAPRQIM